MLVATIMGLLILVIGGMGLMFVLKKPDSNNSGAPSEKEEGGGADSRFVKAPAEGKSKPKHGNSKLAAMAKKIDSVRKEKGDSKLKTLAQHQIDAPPEDFFGRKTEIMNTVGRFKDGNNFNGYSGPRGIGKTATALKVVDKITPIFSEAQIYFNFDLTENPDTATSEAMAHVVNSLAPGSKTPSTPEALLAQYRKLLHGKNILLFFDNVRTTAEVLKLMPPSKSVGLIITSEENLKIENMKWEKIEPLPEEDLKDLLNLWASRIGFWGAEIGRYSAFNPLAASLCGRFLNEFDSFDPEQFATKMRDIFKGMEKTSQNRNQAGIETVLTILFLVIPDPAKVLMSKLMQFRGSFYGDAEAFICEDQENVKLEMLVRLGFVEFNEHTDRYQIPPTIQRWLATKLNKVSPGQTDLRRATFYMTRMQMLNDLFNSNLASKKDQALQLFDLDWKNFQAGQSWAQSNCLKDNEIARICQGFAELGYPLLQLRQSAQNRLPWLEGGLLAAKNLQDDEGELNCLLFLGQEYNSVKNWAKAVESLEKSLALSQKQEKPKVEIEVLHGLGMAFKGQKNWNKALEHFQNEVKAADKIGQHAAILRGEEEIANTHLLAKDPGNAMLSLKKALETVKKLNDPNAQTRLLSALGQAQLESGDSETAIETLQDALKSQAKSGDAKSIAGLHHNLGDAFLSIDEPAKAASSYQSASKLFQKIRDSLGHALSTGLHGACLMLAGDPEQGIKLANSARSILRKIKATGEEIRILGLMGSAFLNARKWEEALKAGQNQRQLAQKAKNSEGEAHALQTMGEAMVGKKNPDEALPLFKNAIQLFGTSHPEEVKMIKDKIKALEKIAAKPSASSS